MVSLPPVVCRGAAQSLEANTARTDPRTPSSCQPLVRAAWVLRRGDPARPGEFGLFRRSSSDRAGCPSSPEKPGQVQYVVTPHGGSPESMAGHTSSIGLALCLDCRVQWRASLE